MIHEESGNLLRAEVEALVNTVNTVGVMGKGVALQFKQAFPENFRTYAKACKSGEVRIGRMFVTRTGSFMPRLIINFPTKTHWQGNSKLEHIETGLADLVRVVRDERIRSIAIPALGCGLGGLRWEDVFPLIQTAFATMPDVEVHVYPPGQVIAPEDEVVNTPKPAMTAWRAALIRIVDAYRVLGGDATHLEAQKLIYFLVHAGEPLKTNFSKHAFGPYDANIRYALQSMNGHYVYGFGDGSKFEPVRLKDGALDEANRFLRQGSDPSADARIERVIDLIDGFETPYGLELLATVHWVVTQEGAATLDQIIERVSEWNDRKQRIMEPRHLKIAYAQLRDRGWLP
ncbi:MAG: macro domain-containing protein [Fimbriimonadaceae bacterium]|nr:macro domain-containing protein [Fimbriimonadaceae bacterium]